MQENPRVLFITPPFTQLNTPYPSTVYLKGYLNTISISSEQADLSLEVILSIFSQAGLTGLFAEADTKQRQFSKNARRMLNRREDYIRTIGPVIHFLQSRNDNLAYLICRGDYLPEAGRFRAARSQEDLEWAFGTMGLRDKARYMATLYLEDLSDLIIECIDPEFGFSRYAEHLGRSASSFDRIYSKLNEPLSFTDRHLIRLLEEKIEKINPEIIAVTIPFPGNLYSALRCGQWIKQHHPNLKIVMGGGFANTELRTINDRRFFEYTDFLVLDDGEEPLTQLIRYVNKEIPVSELVRTFTIDETGDIVYLDNQSVKNIHPNDTGTPDYSGLPLDRYISVIEMINPMHKLWSDGRWNKMTLAHGCYWGKCAFCDGSLDYIRRYAPNNAITLVDRMEQVIAQTGEIGFHFVDEAAPPALLKELATEIIRRKLTVVWWGNIRFEKSFTPELCFLLKSSGCIAVSGGLEVASDRLLQLINKGVTIKQVASAAQHFTKSGIMVHAYLMYGFPTETTQETVDSLEVVRQLFEIGLVQSGFWHRFAMTAHSPVGQNPEKYHCIVTEPPFGGFARNDMQFTEEKEPSHERFGEGLRVSLYNYMNATGFDLPLQKWFDFKIPSTTIPRNFIRKTLAEDTRS